ncbi:MAG TPA: class I SAM-dependent methyltransferase [Candidatus Aquicultor sp.]
MPGHKFHGSIQRFDDPRRMQILPVDLLIDQVKDIETGGAIADLGSGSGYLCIPLARHFKNRATVYAVDINPELLEVIKERAGDLTNLVPILSEENRIPIAGGILDASFMVAVYHELDNPAQFIDEVKRVSRPVHKVIVVDWSQVKGDMGPPLSERIPKPEVISSYQDLGYRLVSEFEPSVYVYGLVFGYGI